MLNANQDVIDRHLRPILIDLLAQCTEKHQNLFVRMYPAGVDKMSTEKIPWAISQCERTIKENESTNKKHKSRKV